jgi:uncharacterized membrane protein
VQPPPYPPPPSPPRRGNRPLVIGLVAGAFVLLLVAVVAALVLSRRSTRLAALTTEVAREQEPRNRLAIVIDGRIVSAPAVAEPITGGTIMLSGGFTRAEARRYVDLLDG